MGQLPDVLLSQWMTKHVGIAPIPMSPFVLPSERHLITGLVRFAFCKDEDSLQGARERLLGSRV